MEPTRMENTMDSSYLMATIGRGAVAVMRGAINLAKLLFIVILLLLPMFAAVLPFNHYVVGATMPADTTERLWGAMAGIMFSAILMGGIPILGFLLYGRKLCARLWHEDQP
jgi:hypothetical protein